MIGMFQSVHLFIQTPLCVLFTVALRERERRRFIIQTQPHEKKPTS